MPEGVLDRLSQAASLYCNRTSLYRHLGIPPAPCDNRRSADVGRGTNVGNGTKNGGAGQSLLRTATRHRTVEKIELTMITTFDERSRTLSRIHRRWQRGLEGSREQ